MELKTNRIEALTDGIFAIVMTIMIVSMSELIEFSSFAKESDYYMLFMSLWKDFASYAISFMLLGAVWLVHHWQFQHISHVDTGLVFINIIWFMFICLVPLSTIMLGNHPDFFAPIFVFECNVLMVFLMLHIQWAYVTRRKKRVGISLDDKMISQQRNTTLSLVIIMVIVIIISYGYHLLLLRQ